MQGKRYIVRLLAFLLLLALRPAAARGAYYTHPVAPEVKTLRTLVDGNFERLPVIPLGGGSRVEISFDRLADDYADLCYTLVHCDRRWEASAISELDYVDGFLPVRVTDAQASFNTFVNYWHYRVAFPNDDVQLLLSGNYAVVFTPEDDPDAVVAVATFAVSEQAAFVGGTVSANTDVDYRAAHQQLSLSLQWNPRLMPHMDPVHDVSLVVTQNRRPDTRREVSGPLRIEAQRAFYEHDRRLLFEAGNTWRRFEFVDERYATLGVENVRYHPPYHHVLLQRARPRGRQPYFYDEDQQGRYLIAAKRVDDADLEADYFWAQFVLDMAPVPEPIFLVGDFTCGEQDGPYRMRYDDTLEAYTAEVLLKQGAYNFQYVTPAAGEGTPPPASTALVEGNHYETRNEYEVYVYYRPAGARYDRLLGVATFFFRPEG